jgi:hypothetical protein
MKSQFQAISEAAAERIRTSTEIPSSVAVVAYERGAPESEIERSVGLVGLCVVVLPFEPVHALAGAIPHFYDQAELVVHVAEDPVVNATGIDGAALRDLVVMALADTDLDGLLAEPLGEHRIQRLDEAGLTIREITWKTAAQMRQ